MPPLSPEDLLPLAELATVRAYAAERHASALGSHLWALLFWAGLVLLGGNGRLVRAADAFAAKLSVPLADAKLARAMDRVWGDRGWIAAGCYLALLLGLMNLWDLPFDLYVGWFRAHRFGTSNQSFPLFLTMLLKSSVTGALSLTALAFGLFGLARKLRRWWLWLGIVAAAGLVAAPLLDPLRARLHFEQRPLEGPLRGRIDALVARAGFTVAGVDVEASSLYSKLPDAYFAGVGPNRRIVLNDNLLQRYTEEEILAAVAHELGHVQEREQAPWKLWAGALFVLPLLWGLNRALRAAAARGLAGIRSATDVAALPLLFFAMALGSELSLPVRNALSRDGEAEADRYGLALQPDPAAFAGLFQKLGRDAKDDPAPATIWVVLFRGHPTILSRVQAVRSFAAERGLPDPLPRLHALRDAAPESP